MVKMAEGQGRPPGVIRNTRDYIRALTTPVPASPESVDRTPSPISTSSGYDDSPTPSRLVHPFHRSYEFHEKLIRRYKYLLMSNKHNNEKPNYEDNIGVSNFCCFLLQ